MFDLPWYGWLFGVVFWSLIFARRYRRRDGLGAAPATDDSPAWSPFRSRGF